MSNYVVQPRLHAARVSDSDKVYKRVGAQTDKWEAVSQRGLKKIVNLCGNVRPVWNKKEKKFVFEVGIYGQGNIVKNLEIYSDMYAVMSSAMLLYRVMCLFKCNVISEGPKGYKCTWWVTLQHKLTGEYLQFGEWKGAAGIWTRFLVEKELPQEYAEDLLLLLNELYSKDCPHPYDGCVAGSVA